jgi:hypothetical protein
LIKVSLHLQACRSAENNAKSPFHCTLQEWTDAASRSMAGPYLQQLIGLDPQSEAEQENMVMSDDDEAADSTAGLQLAGNGGEGLFEAAVTQLVLAVQGAGADFTVAMLDGVAPLAAAAGLLAKPGSDAGAAAVTGEHCVRSPPTATAPKQLPARLQYFSGNATRHPQHAMRKATCLHIYPSCCHVLNVECVYRHTPNGSWCAACPAVCVAEPSLVLQCLAYIKLLLQQLPSGRPVPDEGATVSFDSLWETLLLLALKQEQPEIRWAIVCSVACYSWRHKMLRHCCVTATICMGQS